MVLIMLRSLESVHYITAASHGNPPSLPINDPPNHSILMEKNVFFPRYKTNQSVN